MCRHDRAAGQNRPSQHWITEGALETGHAARFRHVAHDRQEQRRHAAGEEGGNLQGENARPADPADRFGGGEVAGNEGDRSPQSHAGIVKAMPAHSG